MKRIGNAWRWFCRIVGGVTGVLGLSEVPDWIDNWLAGLRWVSERMTAEMIQWTMVLGGFGLIVVSLIPRRHRAATGELAVQPTTVDSVALGPQVPKLSIQCFQNHRVKDLSGLVSLAIRVENSGDSVVNGVRLQIKAIDALESLDRTKPMDAWTNQFNDAPLHAKDPESLKAMNPKAGTMFALCHIHPTKPDWIYFRLDSGSFHLPRGRVRVHLLATAENAVADERAFLVRATANDLTITESGAKPKR